MERELKTNSIVQNMFHFVFGDSYVINELMILSQKVSRVFKAKVANSVQCLWLFQ
jgi:hypothetical protein